MSARPSLDARFRGHDTDVSESSPHFERLTRLAQRFLVYSYQPESQRVGCRRNLLRPSGNFLETKAPKCFACEAIYFACELINFACETILFRRAARKLLKSLGREMCEFAVSCGFQGVTPPFFSRFLFRRPSSEPPVGPSLNLASQNLSDSTNSLLGKAKRRVHSGSV